LRGNNNFEARYSSGNISLAKSIKIIFLLSYITLLLSGKNIGWRIGKKGVDKRRGVEEEGFDVCTKRTTI
jgi:hypothetical protein